MDEVSAHINAEVTSNGAGVGFNWIGFTDHCSASSDDVKTLENHDDNGSGLEVVEERGEEGFGFVLLTLSFKDSFGGPDELHTDEAETSALKSPDDLSNQPSRDSVGLDHDTGLDRKSTRLNSSHGKLSRMPSSA